MFHEALSEMLAEKGCGRPFVRWDMEVDVKSPVGTEF